MRTGNTLVDRLRGSSADHGDAPFLLFPDGGAQSYAAFFADAERMAAALSRAGVQPGDRVAIQAAKTPAMLELYVGAVMAGAVFLPLNPAYTDAEVAYFLSDAEPAVFICDPERAQGAAPIAQAAGVAHLWTLGADGAGSLIDRRDAESPGCAAVPRAPDDLAAILYTSGTTGRSKGAMLTHRALESNSHTLKDLWRFTADDILIHALPIFHTHGLFVATNITLMAGGACLFFPKFDAAAIVDAMAAPIAAAGGRTPTAMMGVPTFYTRLLEEPGLASAARDMRLFVSGSAPLLEETHDRWRAVTGHGILERYGMTETNMTTSNPYDGDRRAGTVGFPLPGVEVKICDPNTGAALPPGEIGVIETRGPNVFAGYWRMPEKTAEELRPDGFFITGDLGVIDPDGYVRIVGRAKDLIITGGYNVYPKEVELALDAIDGVIESAVIGAPDADFGEAVVAVVVVEPGAALTEEAVITATQGVLARFKQPRRVAFVDALPRNAMGKVQKNALRAAWPAV